MGKEKVEGGSAGKKERTERFRTLGDRAAEGRENLEFEEDRGKQFRRDPPKT